MALGCQPFATKQWLSSRPGAATVLLGEPAVEARSSGEGRGLGLFATRTIQAFSEILSEAPTILLGPTDDLPQLYAQFLALREPGSDAFQQKYLALSYNEVPERDARLREKLGERGFDPRGIDEMVKVASIMQTNAFNVDVGDGSGRNHRGLFANVARINHSCAPNAHVCFYQSESTDVSGRMVVHALRDLQAGEEVLIAYFSILLPRSERQSKARKWGFTCQCSACKSDKDSHERQRKVVTGFAEKQTTLMRESRPTLKQIADLIASGQNVISKVSKEGSLRPVVPDLYDNLAMLRAKALLVQGKESQRDGVVEFLEQAAIIEAKLTGASSPATKRRLHKVEQFAARSSSLGSPYIRVVGRDEYTVAWDSA
ncbi:Putative SET domain-containing protein [Septoria linicola]|uniref:SET domain-containing protein n=1 Tax=Septoria linicola TaxID=215465 RepID=A0A9Q9AK59_9PEZI|nr:putative SET domain-containing protein [Septoria linicola]USW47638.1 Putative SET domain-containing protein [Septoria linicola]